MTCNMIWKRILIAVLLVAAVLAKLPDSKFVGRNLNRGASKDEEYSMYSSMDKSDKMIPTISSQQEKEQLYEAYNLLHTLAQDFHKPFDAPAVIVVGHQTSGKSALIEALMGFQFNQVGGGTKTRRPIALRMQYNPNYATPMCFLTTDDGKEEQRSLEDIQAYIESENKRLERDATRSFDPREINIRMEYKYCPNMIVIDTPGLIQAPKGRQLTAQQRALAQASREAEALVLSKIKCEDYIILCVEDTIDWKHAITRNVVMQADPQFLRTVLVSTKLDTKIPQLSESDDLEDYLHAPLIHSLFSQIMGGPFFSSVPSGRVGSSKEFENNEAFVQSLKNAEKIDRANLVAKMGAVKARNAIQNVGISRLRAFLESRVEDCYRRNVAKIVPLLQSDLRSAETKLAEIDTELKSLSVEHLRQMANEYREKFAKELSNAIQGSVKASPMEWGESLETEALRSASFLSQSDVQTDQWQRVLDSELGNNNQKLYGGAQYHRTMREFTVAVRHMPSQIVTEDEIGNAAGMGDRHNGVNFMRAACTIAIDKAQQSFEPMLESLRARTTHIMKRMFPIVEEMVRKSSAYSSSGSSGAGGVTGLGVHSAQFQAVLRETFDRFVDEKVDRCINRCKEDLAALTGFVTWDVADNSGSSTLYSMLPTPKKMAEIWSIARDNLDRKTSASEDEDSDIEDAEIDDEPAVPSRSNNNNKRFRRMPGPTMGWRMGGSASAKKKMLPAQKIVEDWKRANKNKVSPKKSAKQSGKGGAEESADYAITPIAPEDDTELSDHYRIMQITEEMISGTSASRTSALVTALVQFIISSWRNHFARTTEMNFNFFFLLPFSDQFPAYLRNELASAYDSGMSELFDMAETRRGLQTRRAELLAECTANSKLQQRFDQISAQLQAPGNKQASQGQQGANTQGVGKQDSADEDV